MNNQPVQPVQPGSSTVPATLDDCLDWLEDAAARSTVLHDHLAPDRRALAALQLAVDVDEALKAVLQHVQDKPVQVDAEQADALQLAVDVDEPMKAVVQDKRVRAAVDLVAKYAEQADALRPATLALRKLQLLLEQCPSSDNYKIRILKTQLAELTTQHQALVANNQALVTQIQELNTRHQALVASTAKLGLNST
jgi:hypothetical protein